MDKPLPLSQYLGIKHQNFVSCGVYDSVLGRDSRLHIDPLLIKGTNIGEFSDGYALFLKHFSDTARLVPYVAQKTKADRFYNQIFQRLKFKEVANTGLGYGRNGVHGTGISGRLSAQLADSVIDIVRAGIMDPEIFALMPVIEDNVASDRISDMMISILFECFVRYTAYKPPELNITKHIKRITFQFGSFCLPEYQHKPIIFIPQEFLCELPEAHTWDDIETVDNYNRRLKEKVCAAIGIAMKDVVRTKKSEIKDYILTHPCFAEDMLAYYRSLTGVPYNFTNDKLGEYIRTKINELEFPIEKDLPHPLISQSDAKTVTERICNLYKELVEHNRMYKLFYDSKSKRYSETNAQLLFYCIADSFCQTNNIDLTRESDAGAGELDFKLSHGANEKVLIEMKLSNNSQLEAGLKSQLPAYMASERGHYGILLILLINDRDRSRVEKVLQQHQLAKYNGNNVNDIIVINAIERPSASKLS